MTQKTLTLVSILFLGAASSAWAQGKQPEKPAASKPAETKSSGLHKAKDNANKAMDNLANGIDQAASSAKKGANDAMESVDKGVHKVIGTEKK